MTSTQTQMQLIRKLRSPDNKVVVQAVEELRTQGWLSGDTLRGIGLRCANLQGANLQQANLQGTDLRMANLQGANLSKANLQEARLNRANLSGAQLGEANLRGSDLFNADLGGARNLTDAQFTQATRLRVARLPDGSLYDGRYNLAGDIKDACSLRINIDNPGAMADFYGVPSADYLRGQGWARENLSRVRLEAVAEPSTEEERIIQRLRSQANDLVLAVVEELRASGQLSGALLKGADLRQAQLQGADLGLANLQGADLSGANLQGANLSVANLQGANLSGTNLQAAKLLWAGLQKADLGGANLQGADLTGANLRKAQLTGSDLRAAELRATSLKGADLHEANLSGAHNIGEKELAKANRLGGAILPDGSPYEGHLNLVGDAEPARAKA